MKIHCINRTGRKDRRDHIQSQSWLFDVEFFAAVEADGRSRVVEACKASHRAIQTNHLASGAATDLLILEDDALITSPEAYQRFVAQPPTCVTSLGSLPMAREPYFMYAQAIFIPWADLKKYGPLWDGRGNAEYAYYKTYGRIDIFSPPIVIQAPHFTSDRTGYPQSHYKFL